MTCRLVDHELGRLRGERTDTAEGHGLREVFAALVSWQVLRLALIYFGLTTGLYGIELWMPLIIKGFGFGNLAVGMVSAIPYLVALVAMALWARHVDRSSHRFGHVAWKSERDAGVDERFRDEEHVGRTGSR